MIFLGVGRSRALGDASRDGGKILSRWSPALVNVVGLLFLIFFMGGSSRGDVWSLPILRPIAILSLFYGLWALPGEEFVRHRFLFGMAASIFGLIAIQLVPLPPSLWSALGGRGIIMDIDSAADLKDAWRPISMAPQFTWNALFSLAIPLAIMTNAVRLTPLEHRLVAVVLVLGGMLSIGLGLLQLAGSGNPSFYLYRLSDFNMLSGLFANRNHQAIFVAALLPLLAFLVGSSDRSARVGRVMRALVIAGALMVITFLLILGSRAGLVAGVIGLASLVLIMVVAQREGQRGGLPWKQMAIGSVVLTAIGSILAWAYFTDSAESIKRAVESGGQEELRYTYWSVIWDAMPTFMPMGTGVGTYERIFQTFEPDSILGPTYSNHAHNDWLEVALTAGIPGVLLMGAAVLAFLVAVWRVRSTPPSSMRTMAWAGLVILFILALGSLVDYPLRTPILSSIFSLACVWVALSCVRRGQPRSVVRRSKNFQGRVHQ